MIDSAACHKRQDVFCPRTLPASIFRATLWEYLSFDRRRHWTRLTPESRNRGEVGQDRKRAVGTEEGVEVECATVACGPG